MIVRLLVEVKGHFKKGFDEHTYHLMEQTMTIFNQLVYTCMHVSDCYMHMPSSPVIKLETILSIWTINMLAIIISSSSSDFYKIITRLCIFFRCSCVSFFRVLFQVKWIIIKGCIHFLKCVVDTETFLFKADLFPKLVLSNKYIQGWWRWEADRWKRNVWKFSSVEYQPLSLATDSFSMHIE